MKIILPKERPMSLNKFYAGMYWTQRQAEVKRVHWLVQWELKKMGFKIIEGHTFFTKRVDITITAFFDKNPLDSDNIVAKLYIDACKKYLLLDDSRRYVRAITTISEIDKVAPRVEIVIEDPLAE